MQSIRTPALRAIAALFAAAALAPPAFAQPTVVVSPVPKLQFFDNNGKPMNGGCVATYQGGTTVPLATYTDASGATANPNPVALDASGRAAIWIKAPAIKYVVKLKGSGGCSLSTGTIISTTDNVQDAGLRLRGDLATGDGASNIMYQYSPSATPRTVQNRLRDAVSVLDFGVVADGTGTGGTDQSAKIQTAVNAAAGGTLHFPAQLSCYTVWSGILVPSDTTIWLDAGACVQKRSGPAPTCTFTACTAVFTAGDATAAVRNIWFRGGGVVDGNRDNITGISGDGYNQGINFAGCSNCGTEGITVKNAYTGGVSVVCWGAAPSSNEGNNVQILNTIITSSRRNNLEVLCGTNTVMRGGQLSNATGGSLSLGYDIEPFAAGQLVTGAVLDGVEIFGNRDGAINYSGPYDVSPVFTLLNVNAHDNGASAPQAANIRNFYSGGASGFLTIMGGSYVGGTQAAVNLAGWAHATISGQYIKGPALGLEVSANNPNVVLGPGHIEGGTYGLYVDGADGSRVTMAGATLINYTQPGSDIYINWPMTGVAINFTDKGIAYWNSAAPPTGAMTVSSNIKITDGAANPAVAISDGTCGMATLVLNASGTNGQIGTYTACGMKLAANNNGAAVYIGIDSTGTKPIIFGLQQFANNAAAIAGGLTTAGMLYRITGSDNLGVVH